jgi:hypothetical protein
MDHAVLRAPGGGHGCHWRADVQLLDPVFTESMDRSDCAAREDGWLRSKRSARPSRKKESCRYHFSRGCLWKGHCAGSFRFSGTLLLHILALIGLTDVTFIHAENQPREGDDVFFSAAAERISGIVIDQDQQVVAH